MKLNFYSGKNLLKIGIVSALSVVASSCATSPKYYWGNYENIIYTQYNEPGKASPEYQIQKMESDIQVAISKQLPMPPGFYAHLATQYLLAGNAASAKFYFEAEKKSFPESAVLMN